MPTCILFADTISDFSAESLVFFTVFIYKKSDNDIIFIWHMPIKEVEKCQNAEKE